MDGEELCYLQQPYQTKIRVDLSDALRLNEIPNHSISQAQLIIPFEYTSKFDHIDSLKFSYSTDGGETFTILGKVAADVSGGRYLFNFTTFLNRILNGTINTTDIYISDEPYVSNVNAIGVRRSVLHGPSFSEIDRNKNMRLLVTYAH
jgi:hypothetical protein